MEEKIMDELLLGYTFTDENNVDVEVTGFFTSKLDEQVYCIVESISYDEPRLVSYELIRDIKKESETAKSE
jgi:hypothetical protein